MKRNEHLQQVKQPQVQSLKTLSNASSFGSVRFPFVALGNIDLQTFQNLNSSSILTSSVLTIFSMLSKDTFLSPRSMPPT
jgi:hypothetical protein